MDRHKAIAIAKGLIDVITQDDFVEAWQFLVDTGEVNNLEPRLRRQAMHLIDAGFIKERDQTHIDECDDEDLDNEE